MKWAFGISSKTRIASLLLLMFAAILAGNFLDSGNISKLENSFSEVYEDRLLVEGYIYDLSDHMMRKRLLMHDVQAGTEVTDSITSEFERRNNAIDKLLIQFRATNLTEEEARVLASFSTLHQGCMIAESDYMNGNGGNRALFKEADALYDQASMDLTALSDIQMKEGKSIADNSKRLVAGSSLLGRFEIAVLIITGLVIQVLIFSSRTSMEKGMQQQHKWN